MIYVICVLLLTQINGQTPKILLNNNNNNDDDQQHIEHIKLLCGGVDTRQ